MPSVQDGSLFDPGNTVVILVSFEGPDRYAQAGGLAVRVTGLAQALAHQGFETHLFFLGDPRLPGEETHGRLTLHRWAQWISAYHPQGVYDGEEDKRRDLAASLPLYLVDRLIAPAIAQGRIPVVLSEEWQLAEFACLLSDGITATGSRDRAVLAWNANNPYSFDRIDWPRLAATNIVTTVSRYMRSIVRAQGVDALVVPNGIPRLGAIEGLRRNGHRTGLVARSGGPSMNGGGLAAAARARGLTVTELGDPGGLDAQIASIAAADTDVVSLQFGVTEALAHVLYAGSDGVLANSVSEPFGLVGLEAMAARGLVYTGGTGEDYAEGGRNSVVLESLQAEEIVRHAERAARAFSGNRPPAAPGRVPDGPDVHMGRRHPAALRPARPPRPDAGSAGAGRVAIGGTEEGLRATIGLTQARVSPRRSWQRARDAADGRRTRPCPRQ